MDQFILLLHILGAAGMGFYLLLPVLMNRLAGMNEAARAGLAGGLATANRWGQGLLVVQLLTGGYLVGKAGFSAAWMIVVLVLFLAVGAFTAMLGKPLKRIHANSGGGSENSVSKARTFSWLAFLCFLLIVILMVFPQLL